MTAPNRNPFEPMTLENVGDGRAVDLFEAALVEIKLDLANADKDPEDRRQFTLVVDFVPGKTSDAPLEVVVGSKLKLGKYVPHRTYATRDRLGRFIQYRNVQGELELPEGVHEITQDQEAANGDQ